MRCLLLSENLNDQFAKGFWPKALDAIFSSNFGSRPNNLDCSWRRIDFTRFRQANGRQIYSR